MLLLEAISVALPHLLLLQSLLLLNGLFPFEKESISYALLQSFLREEDVDGHLGALWAELGNLFLATGFVVDLRFI